MFSPFAQSMDNVVVPCKVRLFNIVMENGAGSLDFGGGDGQRAKWKNSV